MDSIDSDAIRDICRMAQDAELGRQDYLRGQAEAIVSECLKGQLPGLIEPRHGTDRYADGWNDYVRSQRDG